jgi:glycosyltransferase involved in cell wall biosynthesis
MKIIRIVTELDFGGVEKHMDLTADGMLAYPEYEMIFLALGKGGQTSKVLVEKGFQVIVLNGNPQIPNLGLIIRLVKLFKKLKPDVVHCSNGEGNFHGIWAAWLVRVPVRIGEEVGFPNHHSYWKSIFRWTYRCSHKVIAISNAVKNKLMELGEASDKKIEVIYYPMGEPKLDMGKKEGQQVKELIESLNAGKESSDFTFITTCRLVAIKNLDGLIKALAKVSTFMKNRKINLWIIGEGPEKEGLIQLAKGLGMESHVHFLGFHSNVNPFLMAADSFILPTFSEGFSLSLAEAMQLGLPCIATKIGGPSEIIKPHTGLLLDPYDLDDIASKMDTMIELDPKKRKEMGARGMEDVKSRFSVEIYTQELTHFYDNLMAETRKNQQ